MKPSNPSEVYALIQSYDKEAALTEIDRYHKEAFLHTAGSVSDLEKELGNMRLPTEEIRNFSARKYYRKAVEFIDYMLQYDYTENLVAEKELLKIRYGGI